MHDTLLVWTKLLCFAIGDSSLRKIVRGQLDRYAVAGYDSDKVLPHLACDVSYYFMAIFELDSELCARQSFFDRARKLYNFLVFCHKIYNWSLTIANPTTVCKVLFSAEFLNQLELGLFSAFFGVHFLKKVAAIIGVIGYHQSPRLDLPKRIK